MSSSSTLAAAIAPGARGWVSAPRHDVLCIVGRVEAPRDLVTRAGKRLQIAGLRLHDDTRQNVPVTLFERDAIEWTGERLGDEFGRAGSGSARAGARPPLSLPLHAGDVVLLTRVIASDFRGVVSLKPTFESVCLVLARAGRVPDALPPRIVSAPVLAARARTLVDLAVKEYSYLWAGDEFGLAPGAPAPPRVAAAPRQHLDAVRGVEALLEVVEGAACDVRARVVGVQLASAGAAITRVAAAGQRRGGLPVFATAVLLLPDSPLVPVTLRVHVHPVSPAHVSQGVPGAQALTRQLMDAARGGSFRCGQRDAVADVVLTHLRVAYSHADDCRVLVTTPDTVVVDAPHPPVTAAAAVATSGDETAAASLPAPAFSCVPPAAAGGAAAVSGTAAAAAAPVVAVVANAQPPAKRARAEVEVALASTAPAVAAAAAGAPSPAHRLPDDEAAAPAGDAADVDAAPAAAQARTWELDDDAAATQAGLLFDLLGAAAAAAAPSPSDSGVGGGGAATQPAAPYPPRWAAAGLAFAPRSLTVDARVTAVLWPDAGVFVGGVGAGTPSPPPRARRGPLGVVTQGTTQGAVTLGGTQGGAWWAAWATAGGGNGNVTQAAPSTADVVGAGAAPVSSGAVPSLLHIVCSLCGTELARDDDDDDVVAIAPCAACTAFPPVGVEDAATAGGAYAAPVWAYRPAWLHLQLGGGGVGPAARALGPGRRSCWALLRDDDVLARVFAAGVPAAHVADLLRRRRETVGGGGALASTAAEVTAAAAAVVVPPAPPARPTRVPVDGAIVALLRALCGSGGGAAPAPQPPTLTVSLAVAGGERGGDGGAHFVIVDAREPG